MYEGGDLLIGTEEHTRKTKDIRSNKNVSLLINGREEHCEGMLIDGQVQLDHRRPQKTNFHSREPDAVGYCPKGGE